MSELVTTRVGRLNVSQFGSGPVTVFWHSLFVDQTSWRLVLEALASTPRVVLVDAPNHGDSEPIDRDFTIDDCAEAAVEVLDHLKISEPVDWVGNALGGHVGITLAATQPDRVRSLITIGTPIEPFTAFEKWTKMVPLVHLYRAVGPAPVQRLLTSALVGREAVAARPDEARAVMDAFRHADRRAMFRAMRCLMLHRRSVRDHIGRITAPTLMLVAAGGQEGWTPQDAADAARAMANAESGTLPGAGHVAPLILAPDLVATRLSRFWENQAR